MKKLLVLIIVFIFFLVSGHQVLAMESIKEYKAEISINYDSSVVVTENIVYDFGNQNRHGIYRDIPYSYSRSGSKYNIRLKVLSVVDENGSNWSYTISKLGGEVSIKIGDPDVYVSGVNTYRISYQVDRAINYFDDHDEFYWNVTGTEWGIPIEQVSAIVSFPQTLNLSEIQLACYTGDFASTEQDCNYNSVDDKIIAFTSNKQFSPYQGLTIVLGWPKGIVIKPNTWQQVQWFITDNWPIIIPLVLLGFMFFLWYTRGRDPKVRDTIIPYYEPPNNMMAGELGTVIDEKVDLKDISATIIQLAVKGYLKIKELETKKLFGKGKDYQFIQLKEADNKLEDYERLIFNGIFDAGKTRTISSMKNNFYKHLKKIKKSVYEMVVINGYFPTNPEKVRQLYMGITFFIIPLGIFLLIGFGNFIAGIATIILGIIGFIFSRAMPRKTKKGAITHKQILGFKWFLSVTEKERLKFHNAPAKSPKEFEELLPYAMVLGVEKEWAKQFDDIYLTPPEWYEGSPGAAFGALYIANSLGSFSTSLNRAMVAAPRGSSTAGFGGSGFGGGGFSGGGFGGGGGGSW